MATKKKTTKAATPKNAKAPKKAPPKAKKPLVLIPGAIDARLIGRMARAVVLRVADMDGSGEDKHAKAVRVVAAKVDAALVWPATPVGLIAEALDGIAAQILLGAVVKHAYNALKSEGKIR